MATMNISLPDQMKGWIEAQVATGRYANSSDYVRDAVRDALRRDAALVNMQSLVKAGRDSGISARNFNDIMGEARKRATSE